MIYIYLINSPSMESLINEMIDLGSSGKTFKSPGNESSYDSERNFIKNQIIFWTRKSLSKINFQKLSAKYFMTLKRIFIKDLCNKNRFENL